MSKKPKPTKKTPESDSRSEQETIDRFSWNDGDIIPLDRDERLEPRTQDA